MRRDEEGLKIVKKILMGLQRMRGALERHWMRKDEKG